MAAICPEGRAAEIKFNRDVRPLLTKHCFACHGRDEEAREADLRLDVRDAAVEQGAIVSGKPEASELIARVVSQDADLLMPPPDAGDPLDDQEIQILRRWITEGAPFERHWAFEPPVKAELPAVKQADWPSAAIDYFVLAKLEANGLNPSPAADRETLVRRLSLDLTGLPPTLAEADAFLRDDSPEAYEKVVDRLLQSDAFGEHWARMWLDLARYADTKGYEKDRHRDIWRYRDWVIEALNQDLPFDQFTEHQLAGDLLDGRNDDHLIATAFHRNTMTNEEGGTDDEEFRVAAVKDRVDTTIQVWMGLTMGCAKCHSHKYDPISLGDYYSFYALFNQTQDNDREAPLHPTPTIEQTQRIKELQERIKSIESEGLADAEEKLKQARDQLNQARAQVTKTPVLLELSADKQRVTRLHRRGNFLDPGDPVQAKILSQFGSLPDGAPLNRLGVARWLTEADNPLTSRVMVNRVWARLFGLGIVETEEDFGTQGTLPTHPELLDWLAVDYRENGWSLKKLLKTIVMSQTYRQRSVVGEDSQSVDPRNRLLSRAPRFRLSAEAVRDQALAVSGLLTNRIGGPSVMPPQPGGVWKSTYSGETWKNAVGSDRYRRGLYTYLKRTSPYPAMMTFDGGSGEVCQIRRIRTNTPLQALVTLNDTVYLEAAGALARQMDESVAADETTARDGAGMLKRKVRHGFRRVLIRDPRPEELQRLLDLYFELKGEIDDGSVLLGEAGLEDGDPALVLIASVILNLDETLTKP